MNRVQREKITELNHNCFNMDFSSPLELRYNFGESTPNWARDLCSYLELKLEIPSWMSRYYLWNCSNMIEGQYPSNIKNYFDSTNVQVLILWFESYKYSKDYIGSIVEDLGEDASFVSVLSKARSIFISVFLDLMIEWIEVEFPGEEVECW